MSDRSAWQLPSGTGSDLGPIAAFFQAATLLAQDAGVPVSLAQLGSQHARAQRTLASLHDRYELLRTDETIAACAPLGYEIAIHYCRAADAVHQLDVAWQHAIEGIQDDCHSMAASVQTLRTIARTAVGTVCSTRDCYETASAAYRDTVARGARVRALLGDAEAETEHAQIAFEVTLLLRRACDAFGSFMRLHSAPPRTLPF